MAFHASSSSRLSAALLACALCLLHQAQAQGWMKARATAYGGTDDWWSIHEGSCGFGYLDEHASTGWDVAALSDHNGDFVGSCGRCYEVKCDPTVVTDGYGETLDRTKVCWDPEASVVVQVTDACQCNYAPNKYSNMRWCCGDQYHMDISATTFAKLGDKKQGVIGLLIRPVPCTYQPARVAAPPAGVTPVYLNNRLSRPADWSDKRPVN